MSRRDGIQITVKREADGGETPNRYVPLTSAHVRVYWPPRATIDEVYAALDAAYDDALDAIHEKYYPFDQGGTDEA